MLGRAVDGTADIRLTAGNGPKVDNVARVLGLKFCNPNGMINDKWARACDILTLNKQLCHVDETQHVGLEHALHIGIEDVTDAFHAMHEASVVDCRIIVNNIDIKTANICTDPIYRSYEGPPAPCRAG